jgi:hypothetical protein
MDRQAWARQLAPFGHLRNSCVCSLLPKLLSRSLFLAPTLGV